MLRTDSGPCLAGVDHPDERHMSTTCAVSFLMMWCHTHDTAARVAMSSGPLIPPYPMTFTLVGVS
jgi:hypothetical protein